MANLRDIRDRIGSVKNTQQITRAMKMVAAARLRKAQERAMAARPYSGKLDEIISRLSAQSDGTNPLLQAREETNNVLFIVIGSDRGLCGGFNNNLFRVIENTIKSDFQQYVDAGTFSMITIGKKPGDFFSKRYNVIERHDGFFDDMTFDKASKLMNEVRSSFSDGTYDAVHLAFNEFKSVIAQNRIIDQLLPVQNNVEVDEDVDQSTAETEYLYEPDSATILDKLIPLHLNMQLWRALLESYASEQGARMAAMDSATENAKEIIGELQLKYNQLRQAAITTEISEIVSGAEALSQ